MIVPGPATRIFLAPGPTDLRRSFDGLHGLVRAQLQEDARRAISFSSATGCAPVSYPDAPGTAMFDAVTKTLAIPAMPAHGTSIRAFRKPAGGVAELADTSSDTTVSVVAMGPFTPGVTYELWVTGHNFRGDGPESNHVSHTAA